MLLGSASNQRRLILLERLWCMAHALSPGPFERNFVLRLTWRQGRTETGARRPDRLRTEAVFSMDKFKGITLRSAVPVFFGYICLDRKRTLFVSPVHRFPCFRDTFFPFNF